MADVDMAVSELNRATGIVDMTLDANVELGNAGTPFFFPNDGMTFLLFNAPTGDTITFVGYSDPFSRVAAAFTFVVAAGKIGLVGPFDPALWNDTSERVEFTLGVGNVGDYYLAVRITQNNLNGT